MNVFEIGLIGALGFQSVVLGFLFYKLNLYRHENKRDGLTGLFNKEHLHKVLAREQRNAERTGYPLSVLMIDIDHFKQFNDSLGHLEGDRLLKTISRILKKHVRDFDFAARFGGDEFVLLLPGASKEHALKTGNRIREEVYHSKFYTKCGKQVTLSLGAVTAKKFDESLLGKADEALYVSKQTKNKLSHIFIA